MDYINSHATFLQKNYMSNFSYRYTIIYAKARQVALRVLCYAIVYSVNQKSKS